MNFFKFDMFVYLFIYLFSKLDGLKALNTKSQIQIVARGSIARR